MTSSEKNILSYFKQSKEKNPAKRLKLDEAVLKETTLVPEKSISTNSLEYTKITVKDDKKSKQVSITEAFSKVRNDVTRLAESPSRNDQRMEEAETPKQPAEPVNNRKRRIESSETDVTPSSRATPIECPGTTRLRNNGTPASVKKRLIMSDEAAPASPKSENDDPKPLGDEGQAKKVPFTLKGQLSPLRNPVEVHIARVNCTPENTRTPIKRIPVIPDIKSPRAKQLFGSPSKKLNPLELRAKLGKVGKLSELQARLASVNENLQKIHTFRESHHNLVSPRKTELKKDLDKFSSLDVEVPASPRKLESPRKIDPSPVKTSTAPAYERYAHLAEAGPPTLTLPFKFKVLEEMFRNMDVVSSFMYNRQERITFKKIKAGVQEMMRRDFTKRHIRQIVAVFPEAYKISYEKVQTRFTQASPGKDEYEMIITPLVDTSRNPPVKTSGLKRVDKSMENLKSMDFKPMPPTALLERRTIFHGKLVTLVKQYHADYLASLIPPVKVPEDKLTKWHPCFSLDEVPDVDPEGMPASPAKNKLGSAKEILEKAHHLLSKNPRMLDALQSAANREVSTSSSDTKFEKPAEPAAPLNPALKGVPQALLDKIRAREAEKMKMVMTQNPEDIRAGLMAGRLPDLARTISHIFVTDKKPAIATEVLGKRMMESTKLVTTLGSADEHLQLIAKVCPEWLTLHQLQGKTFVKVNRKLDINSVVSSLEKFKKSTV